MLGVALSTAETDSPCHGHRVHLGMGKKRKTCIIDGKLLQTEGKGFGGTVLWSCMQLLVIKANFLANSDLPIGLQTKESDTRMTNLFQK